MFFSIQIYCINKICVIIEMSHVIIQCFVCSSTEQALEPLGYQLVELETAVQEQRDKLSAVKSNILRNNEKISRLMGGINLNI